jgi:hypothetical protein
MQTNVICPCQVCNGRIEFDSSLFQAGTVITCPHCAAETTLFFSKMPPSPSGKKDTAILPLLPKDVSYIKMLCPLCDGSIDFPAHAFGEKANCPHCGRQIALGMPSEPSVGLPSRPAGRPTATPSNASPSLPKPQAEPPVKLPPSSNPLRQQIMKNLDRKVLTGIAVLAFVISACNAPWEIRYEPTQDRYGILPDTKYVVGPVWQPPDATPPSGYYSRVIGRPSLLIIPLAATWIGIGVVYTALFFLLKETNFCAIIVRSFRPGNDVTKEM